MGQPEHAVPAGQGDPLADPPPVTLREITDENRADVENVTVAAGQDRFVASVAVSFRDAAQNPDLNPWCRAVYAGDVLVGFVMLADGVPAGNTEIPWPYYLWRFLIGAEYQGHGYGRAALDLVVAYVRSRPGADALWTSIVAGDGSPRDFYLRYGFTETGEMYDGEHVLRLSL